jgi:hypothetical protein
MQQSKCPICSCKEFHVKNPDDAYEIYAFEYRDGKICFDPGVDSSGCPQIDDGTETFCNACAWHDKFSKIK